jgi:hypothetical protein
MILWLQRIEAETGRYGLEKLKNNLETLFFFLVGIGFSLGGIALKLGTLTEPGPGFFPFWGGLCLLVIVGLLFYQNRHQTEKSTSNASQAVGPILVIGALVFCVAFFETLGYVIAMTVVSITLLHVLKTKPIWLALVISLALSVASYLIFHYLLSVPLPLGILA